MRLRQSSASAGAASGDVHALNAEQVQERSELFCVSRSDRRFPRAPALRGSALPAGAESEAAFLSRLTAKSDLTMRYAGRDCRRWRQAVKKASARQSSTSPGVRETSADVNDVAHRYNQARLHLPSPMRYPRQPGDDIRPELEKSTIARTQQNAKKTVDAGRNSTEVIQALTWRSPEGRGADVAPCWAWDRHYGRWIA